MEKIATPAGDYIVYQGSEARRNQDQHESDQWYFEPEGYGGFTVFSEAYASLEEARQAALDTGSREERLNNDIGGM